MYLRSSTSVYKRLRSLCTQSCTVPQNGNKQVKLGLFFHSKAEDPKMPQEYQKHFGWVRKEKT